MILPARVVAWDNMTTEREASDSGETEEQRLSKSARKREAATLQELGVKLSALPDQEIRRWICRITCLSRCATCGAYPRMELRSGNGSISAN